MKRNGVLCVANWDSGVGYAWWLMESFWVRISEDLGGVYDVHLAYPSISKLPESVSNSELIVHEVSFSRNSGTSIFGQMLFLRKHRIKYIYFSDRPFFSLRYAFFKLIGVKKIIVHDHTPGVRDYPVGIKRMLKIIRARLPLVNCDAVIGATEFVKARCIEVACYPQEKCFSAQNGIPIDIKRCKTVNIREKYSIPTESIVIVTVGRVTEYKGIFFAIDVVEEMVRRGGRVHYIYFGDGPDKKKCENVARKKKLTQYITFPGKVDCLHDLLLCCDVAFHPSKGEVGYSLSILEYIRAGLPVVVSDNPSVSGAIEHMKTGVVYKENNIQSAAEALSVLINKHDLREAISRSAMRMLKEKYSLSGCHEKFSRVIKKIIF